MVLGEATVQFLALGLGYGKRLGVLSDAIPHGLNKLNTLPDTKAQDSFKLGWTHAPKFTRASARMQSVRPTLPLSRGGSSYEALRRCFRAMAVKARSAWLTDRESRNTRATSGSSTTTLLPAAYRRAYLPRTPPEKSYSRNMPA